MFLIDISGEVQHRLGPHRQVDHSEGKGLLFLERELGPHEFLDGVQVCPLQD